MVYTAMHTLILLISAGLAVASQQAAPFITDGGFESGTLDAFKHHTFGRNSLTIVSPGISGSYGLEFKGKVTDRDGTNSLQQTMSNLKPGAEYRFLYDGHKLEDFAEYPDLDVGGKFFDSPFPRAPAHYHFNKTFIAQNARTYFIMYFEYGPVVIDNLRVEQVT